MRFNPLLFGFLTWQGVVSYKMGLERDTKYEMARAYAKSVGKPLLVVGGPYGSMVSGHLLHIQAHGYGDVCLDIDPAACQGCPHGCVVEIADVRDIPYPDKYFGSALCSHILEHLPSIAECEKAWTELNRVSDAVFVAGPSKASLIAWLVPEHHLWITQNDDGILVESREGEGIVQLTNKGTEMNE